MKKLLVLLFMACSFTAVAESDSSQTGTSSVTECEDGFQGNRSSGKALDTATTEETKTESASGDSQ